MSGSRYCGAIFGGVQRLSSYYICLVIVKLRKVDDVWEVDGEEEVELVTIDNRKIFTPSKLLENVWSNLAGREVCILSCLYHSTADMSKVEFVDRYLSMDSGQASLVNTAARKAIHKKMAELGKFIF